MISFLPESLQCHILSFLTTDEAVFTSVLSSTWRYLWKWVPELELESSDFPNDEACVDFIDKFLNFQNLHEFNLCIYSENSENDVSLYEPCLRKLIKHKIQRFIVECLRDIEIPLSLPVCETLVSLKLFLVKLNDFGSLSFPCLKILYLQYVMFPEPLVLDTPRLEELILEGCEFQFKSFKIISMSDSVKVDIDFLFELKHSDLSERNIIYNFLNNFLNARDMNLSTCALDERLIDEPDLKVDTIPSKLPSCLVSSLECVEIRSDITEEAKERKLVRYFLDNATKLKKLVLRLNVYGGEKPHNFGLWKQQFDSPRRSGLCLFEVLPVVLTYRKP